MIHSEFIKALADEANVTVEDASLLLSQLERIIYEGIDDNETVAFQGFGCFEPKQKAERKMYNPTIRDYLTIPGGKSVAFRPSTLIKEKLNPKE